MMRLFQVDWIEIILCIRNFMTSVIMEMDEDIIVIPLQCQSKVAVVWQVNVGTLANDKGKTQLIDVWCDFWSYPTNTSV